MEIPSGTHHPWTLPASRVHARTMMASSPDLFLFLRSLSTQTLETERQNRRAFRPPRK